MISLSVIGWIMIVGSFIAILIDAVIEAKQGIKKELSLYAAFLYVFMAWVFVSSQLKLISIKDFWVYYFEITIGIPVALAVLATVVGNLKEAKDFLGGGVVWACNTIALAGYSLFLGI